MSVDAGLERLRALADRAADSVVPHLGRIGIEEYRAFLSTMYHYTRTSGAKALRAAEVCPSEDLRAFFRHVHDEEKGHYRLAEADLEALGFLPDERTPAPVRAFEEWWDSIGPANHAAYVGALVVFENIATRAAGAVSAMVSRLGLAKTEARWLLVHVEADQDHGREALDMGARALAVDPENVLAGAEKACALWIAIFRSAFEEPVSLRPR